MVGGTTWALAVAVTNQVNETMEVITINLGNGL